MMKSKFNKRLYRNLGELINDFRYVFSRKDRMKPLMSGQQISPAFRERLMLAVTQVNGCRYCNYFHTKQALAVGIDQQELEKICEQSFANCPPEEQPALLYAQHWAESNAQPDKAAANRMVILYGEEKAELIDLSLRVIRVGNLTGNLLDYILFRLTLGRVGGRADGR